MPNKLNKNSLSHKFYIEQLNKTNKKIIFQIQNQ